MIAVGHRCRFEVGVAVVVAVALAAGGGGEAGPTRRVAVQAAVTSDGFVVATRGEDTIDVIPVERDGSQGRRLELPDRDLRVAGGSARLFAGWIASKRVQLATVEDRDVFAEFGKDAVQLCEGVASNDDSFAFSWLERDGAVWLVHGPTGRPQLAGADVVAPDLAAGTPTWCGVTSSGPSFMMLRRDDKRLTFIRCTKKAGCRGPYPFLAFPADHAIAGFGCIEKGCLLADRGPDGTSLVFVTQSGGIKWRRPVVSDGPVSIAGAGDRAFAVGFLAADGATVVAVDAAGGDPIPRWHNAARVAPVVSWSQGRALVALRKSDTELLTETFVY